VKVRPPTECAARRLEVIYLPVSDLVEDPQNARKHSQKQLQKLAAGMNKFGFVNPILIDRSHMIIAGHARFKASLMIGMSHVPTILLDGLSESGRKALAIADNKLGDMSTFDPAVLTQILAELDAVDYGIEFTAFDRGSPHAAGRHEHAEGGSGRSSSPD
jgi:ParB-like chromosome segregation protein Spo0J